MPQRDSAGGIVVSIGGRIALVEQHGNSWSFPKGGIEAGETLLQAAQREIAEETGLTELSLLGELGSYERYSIAKDGIGESTEFGLRKRTMFLFTTKQDFPPQHTDSAGEVTASRWATLEEAYALLTHPKDKEFLQSVAERVQSAVE